MAGQDEHAPEGPPIDPAAEPATYLIEPDSISSPVGTPGNERGAGDHRRELPPGFVSVVSGAERSRVHADAPGSVVDDPTPTASDYRSRREARALEELQSAWRLAWWVLGLALAFAVLTTTLHGDGFEKLGRVLVFMGIWQLAAVAGFFIGAYTVAKPETGAGVDLVRTLAAAAIASVVHSLTLVPTQPFFMDILLPVTALTMALLWLRSAEMFEAVALALVIYVCVALTMAIRSGRLESRAEALPSPGQQLAQLDDARPHNRVELELAPGLVSRAQIHAGPIGVGTLILS